MLNVHQALVGEIADRLPGGVPSGRVALGQLPLRRELCSGLQLASDDAFPQLLGDAATRRLALVGHSPPSSSDGLGTGYLRPGSNQPLTGPAASL